MLVYPQIMAGALAQYPLQKTRETRSTSVRTAGGVWHTRHDADADAVSWTLRYEHLDEEEAERLREFFREAGGRLRPFTFVDPLANLLRWTGALTDEVWEKGLTGVAPSAQPDANGGQEAFTLSNPSGAAHGIAQTVAAPGDYQYALSTWLRGAAGTKVWLKLAGAAEQFEMNGQWQRRQMTAQAGAGATVRFAIELEPGGVCEAYGPQAEAQRAASPYKRAGGGRAVYSSARFDMDELTWVLEGPGQFHTAVRIRSRS